MIRMLLTIAAGVMLLFLGCYKADVQVPDYGSWGQPPPPAIITPANPNDKADLIRENQELRDRLAWVENQNHHDAHKYNELGDDIAKVREKLAQYQADRDRYKAQAEERGRSQ